MRILKLIWACLPALLAVGAFAQEGHPLVGTWHGSWAPDAKTRNDVTVVMDYDGKNITGIINPGFDGAKFQKATLDPSNWGVHVEADMKDKSGTMVHVTLDGKIENITNVRRSISGTWMQGNAKGDFKITRDN
jgi:hypothetical protein